MPRARTRAEINNRNRKTASRVSSIRRAPNTGTMSQAALVPVDKPLTVAMQLFVKFLAEGDNVPGALTRAGYSETPSWGYRLLKMPNVLAALKAAQDENARIAELTKRDVIEMHKEAFAMAKLLAEPASMVAAARELGKMCGFYEPKKVEITLGVEGRKKVEEMTDAELFEAIEVEMSKQEKHALPAPAQ